MSNIQRGLSLVEQAALLRDCCHYLEDEEVNICTVARYRNLDCPFDHNCFKCTWEGWFNYLKARTPDTRGDNME